MILYVDTSALVKKYILEIGSDIVHRAISEAEVVGMSIIGQVEVSAAFSKAVRVGFLKEHEALVAQQSFKREWGNLMQIQMIEMIIARAVTFVWEYGLRGYDAVHLASAIIWQENIRQPVTMAVFDKKLWTAVQQAGLIPFPSNLNSF